MGPAQLTVFPVSLFDTENKIDIYESVLLFYSRESSVINLPQQCGDYTVYIPINSAALATGSHMVLVKETGLLPGLRQRKLQKIAVTGLFLGNCWQKKEKQPHRKLAECYTMGQGGLEARSGGLCRGNYSELE